MHRVPRVRHDSLQVETVEGGTDDVDLAATHCNTLQHTGIRMYVEKVKGDESDVDFKYNTLQPTATHCNTLQHTAT